ALPQQAQATDPRETGRERRARVPPLHALRSPRGGDAAPRGQRIDGAGAGRIEERPEARGLLRERLEPEAAELTAEGRRDRRRDANRGAIHRNDHEACAVGARIEWRREAGAGRVEEIAPGAIERGEQDAFAIG